MEKNVLNRLYKSEIKVELGVLDQVKVAIEKVGTFDNQVNAISANAERANKLFVEAMKQKEQILKEYTDNRTIADNLLKELNTQFKTIGASAKELGIDVATMPIYKEYLAAQDRLTKGRDKNQSAWEQVSKY